MLVAKHEQIRLSLLAVCTIKTKARVAFFTLAWILDNDSDSIGAS